MAQTMRITRSTKLGFGYTSACEQTENGLQVCEVDRPDYSGTIKTVSQKMENDRTLQSFHGGTYYNTAWFVKVNDAWKEISWTYPSIFDLLTKIDGHYWFDSLDVTVA